MSDTFDCPACQRSFKWKPELAGRRVKCKCGQPIKVPAELVDDDSFEDEFEDEFDDVDDFGDEYSTRQPPRRKGSSARGSSGKRSTGKRANAKSSGRTSGSKNSGGSQWMWWLLGGSVLTIAVCCGGGFWAIRGQVNKITAGIEVPDGQTFSQWRDGFQSRLTTHGPAPQEYTVETPYLPSIEEVTYESEGLQLKAWVQRPEGRGDGPFPALIFLHGGFAFGAGDLQACEVFVEQGYVVMAPMMRGENGNPGEFELFLGEVDDARAAAQWIANQPYVDRNRVFAFGHSVGGGISSVLSLLDDVPVQHTGSSGGLYDHLTFLQWGDISPFPNTPEERSVRLLVGNTAHLQRPHYGYVGDQDIGFHGVVEQMKSAANPEGRLHVEMIPGDHFSSFDAALLAYLRVCEQ